MPVIIDDNNAVQHVSITGAAKKGNANNMLYTPKFFHKNILTGKGGQSRGLLNEKWDPKMNASGYQLTPNPDMKLSTHHNKDIKLYNIPCYLISRELWENAIRVMPRPDVCDMTKIAERGKEEVYITAPIHAIQVQEQQVTSDATGASVTHTEKSLAPLMNVFVYIVRDMNNPDHENTGGLQHLQLLKTTQPKKGSTNLFYQDICSNLVSTLLDIYTKLTDANFTVDKQALDDFLQNYSLYTELCKAAEKWLTQTDYYMNEILIKNVYTITHGTASKITPGLDTYWIGQSNSVMAMLSRLEKYSVPLDQYKAMYDNMAKTLSPDIVAAICKANLNLLLSNTLQHMDSNRAQNTFVPCKTHVKSKIPFSLEQTAAIESDSPFVLVQSGAGTGKSTVIRGRIDHMIANGVKPEDITVLSFTNAAANHIKDLQPNVHSMTIAAMLHTIYSFNYPTQQLSSLSTILNSLDIYFSSSNMKISEAQRDFVDRFKRVLIQLRDDNAYTQANNFVEDHIDETLDTLNVIRQTSLELESIICYQRIETLNEPPEVQAKHMIIDEVQDNSIAEFIYSIKYTDKHQCSMYIVGDCSQTLYEFRASNPKALNVLESSGVFETYKLQTNYRSNQEILDFANILLGNIEANQYANIQLKANSLATVTEQSFKDAVTLHYERLQNKSPNSMENMIGHMIAIDAKKWMDDKLAKGEQVAILAPRRYTLGKVEEYLRKIYSMPKSPNGVSNDIVSLVPIRQRDNAVLSKFIARYWENIQYVPPANIVTTIRRELSAKFEHMMPYRNQAAMQRARDDVFGKPGITRGLLGDFENMHGARIIQWQNQVSMSVMTTAQMLEEVKKLMIDFEIKRNAVMKSVISAKNEEEKRTQSIEHAKFILSTIHSAKGLEFDNVLVVYENESAANVDEASKRMYYVAFTRAKKAEFIFAYDTMAHPKICGDYDKIIKDLAAQAANAAASPDADDADDDKADTADTQSASQTGDTAQTAETPVEEAAAEETITEEESA